MTQTCHKCSRVNPADASYCYYDGSVLAGHTGRGVNGGPINTGTQPFHNQFVFPTGQICRNFDELTLACQENWKAAVDLLKQGYLETFLGGLGRADLAMAAREAARFPDHDRGLDQLLAKLPSQVVSPPKLDVAPREVNLGQLAVGDDRSIDLHLTNQGMRLVYGSVSCDDCTWLALGEAPGAPQKLFQFDHELLIPVHVRGKRLRAGNKPLEGRLSIESNGGIDTVTVRCEVPVKPYPDGVLAGARSPRQIAEKAKLAAKDAAPLFEKGAVAKWYEANGWTYPVQGPSASGLGAVQQFFEALGVTPPPKVEINTRSVALQGNVGDALEYTLEVKTQEKRPVYAHASSDQPWLEAGRAQLNGRTATITVRIPSVPDRQGETLRAKVTVRANGNQRFIVPFTVDVGGNFNFADATPAAEPAAALAPSLPGAPPAPPRPGRSEKAPAPLPLPVGEPGKPPRPWLHSVPAGLLALGLLLVLVWDLVWPPQQAPTDAGTGYWGVSLLDADPRIGVKFNSKGRFGIVMLREHDPNDPAKFKRLTRAEDGWSNNTRIRLDGRDNLFGQEPGEGARDHDGALKQVALPSPRHGWLCAWVYPQEKVHVRQAVEIVPNEQTHLLDTCLVHFLIENRDTVPHNVGLRLMLDTFIGTNDGVPFVIPGQQGLLQTMKVFGQKEIPDYIEALEKPDLKNPGTIAHVGLKLPSLKILSADPSDLDPMETMVVCRWPASSEAPWDWEYKPMNEPASDPDSCVALYWGEQKMEAGTKRAIAFTYGLGMISSAGTGQLGVSAGGAFRTGGVFTVTALVKSPQDGQKVKIQVPPGLALEAGQPEEKPVEKAKDYSQVSWKVRAEKEGTYQVSVSTTNATEQCTVRIREAGLFR